MEIKTPFISFRGRFRERIAKIISDEEYQRFKDELEKERKKLRGKFKKT